MSLLIIFGVCNYVLPWFFEAKTTLYRCGQLLHISLHAYTKLTMTTPLAFAVRRKEPVLVVPATLTPRETKRLSDIDDQEMLRSHMPFLFVYRGGGGSRVADGLDPVATIRRALGEALVLYYPIAGRLREVEEQKLVVDCTGEGVLFVEADADVQLVELEAPLSLVPPLPWIYELVCNANYFSGVLNSPLLSIQVTRLLCGGFILALHMNHAIFDAIGFDHFLSAIAERARGLPSPTTNAPPWTRELLEARVPPRPTIFPLCVEEYDAMRTPPAQLPPTPPGDMVVRMFTFTRRDFAPIKKCLPTCLHSTTTTFEALLAALWRAHTAALELSPCEEVHLLFTVSIRGVHELGIPTGYFGNAIVPSTLLTTVGELQAGSLGDTVEMVRKAKAAITAEYVRSFIDLLVLRGWPSALALANLFTVSDIRHLRYHRLDLGWGMPVYGGIAAMYFGGTFLVPVRDGDGEDDVVVPIVLPRPAMDRFTSELEKMVCPLLIGEHSTDSGDGLLVSLESCKALFP